MRIMVRWSRSVTFDFMELMGGFEPPTYALRNPIDLTLELHEGDDMLPLSVQKSSGESLNCDDDYLQGAAIP